MLCESFVITAEIQRKYYTINGYTSIVLQTLSKTLTTLTIPSQWFLIENASTIATEVNTDPGHALSDAACSPVRRKISAHQQHPANPTRIELPV